MKFFHPLTKKEYNLDNNNNKFYDIHDLYINDGKELNEIQSDFYNDVQFPNYNNIDDFGTLIEKVNKNPFIKKLDEEIGYHKKILEVGCGTGQLSIALSRYNREIHAIDLSKGSLIEAKKFLEKNNINNLNLYRMNIFNLFFQENYFDFVISNGVLHHTHNCRLAFSKICKHLKIGGYVIIGLYHKYGRKIQQIRQMFFPLLKENLKYFDKRFKENISDKKKYAWFLDQYNNPHETVHTYKEVLTWFKEENIEFINSLPFDFDVSKRLLIRTPERYGVKLLLNEMSLILDSRQIYEGGFFIMIGKKK